MGRPLAQRLLLNLADIRKELIETVRQVPDADLEWAPAEGMKSYRAQLQEIGTMEKLCMGFIDSGELLPWEMSAYAPSATVEAGLAELEAIRSQTIAYLESASEDKLQTPVASPDDWKQYFGDTIEPEEVIRWIAMHEYYHMGQIIAYRWSQGHSPYV